MSLSSGNVHRVVIEDCRDFLRTGRCKYGTSCKYNHPANVQNGGGIKQLDPSEPMFPLRPNEPMCQYYMKHGTCKFGQACKFHHPPQSTLLMSGGGGTIRRPEPATQLLLNPVGPDPNGQGMMLQFLPQRPEEADCIYFLKNGRCKYGATCRYHHPIHPQQPRTRLDSRRVRQDSFGRNNGNASHKVQYVAQVIHKYPNVVDASQGYVLSGSDSFSGYAYNGSSVVMTEQSSSASSVASSFDTNQYILGEARPKRNVSVGSFNSDSRMPLVFMPHSVSEGNMTQRRGRAASHGSISDTVPSHFDQSTTSSPRNTWGHRSQSATLPRHHESSPRANGGPAQNPNRRSNPRRRHPRNPGAPDEGFTMMTSALLNMLDTTEEIVGESHSDEEFYNRDRHPYDFNNGSSGDINSGMILDRLSVKHISDHQPPLSAPFGSGSSFEPLPQTNHEERSSYPGFSQSDSQLHPDDWKPSWHHHSSGSDDASFPMLANHTSAPSPHDSDIGLFLP